MIKWITIQYVAGLNAATAYEFLVDFGDRAYRNWWPGMHFQAKPLRRCLGHVGSRTLVVQDIGPYRLKMIEETTEVVPDRKIALRVRGIGGLPVRMSYEFADDADGVTITYTTTAGFTGPLRFLNPLFRFYFTPRFEAALDEHLKEEFLRLASLQTQFADVDRSAQSVGGVRSKTAAAFGRV